MKICSTLNGMNFTRESYESEISPKREKETHPLKVCE